MRILLDTCIVIDVLQARNPFNESAEKIFLGIANNHYEGYITAKSVTDIYYLTHRCTHSDKDTRKIITNLISLFNVLDTTDMDIRKAVLSNISDYEDAVMTETAIRTGMDCIITRNKKDYLKSNAVVYSPEEFLKMVVKG